MASRRSRRGRRITSAGSTRPSLDTGRSHTSRRHSSVRRCSVAPLVARPGSSPTPETPAPLQGAHELHDDELLALAIRARVHSRRQLTWLTTMVEHEAPDAIAVVPDQAGQLAASLPAHPRSIAPIPDPLWA